MLEPAADEIRRWNDAATELITEYLGGLRERQLYPQTTSESIRAKLDSALPIEGASFDELLGTFRDVIVPFARQNAHPRMFGYVTSPGTHLAALADLLASTLNANLTAWRSAPAPVELERLTIDWIRQILGFDSKAGGLFVSGGSVANLTALAVASNARVKGDTTKARIYASSETHFSIVKAAALLGIGRENVRMVEVDERFQMRVDDLEAIIKADLKAGYLPFCVVANAGTVNTGGCDPMNEIREIATRFDLWMHVDASYGGFAILAASARQLFSGIAQADSVALDPHKWLYLPVDCGCVIYRDPSVARETFAQSADYTRIIGHRAEEAFAFWDYGPELSRRFRALKVWMLLKGVGLAALSDSIENDLECARHLERIVRSSEDFQMLAPVQLSIFCFRYVGSPLQHASEEKIDRFNERLLLALQHDGSSYLSNTMIHGRFSLRGCVMNYRTTPQDMELLLDDLRRIASSIASLNPA